MSEVAAAVSCRANDSWTDRSSSAVSTLLPAAFSPSHRLRASAACIPSRSNPQYHVIVNHRLIKLLMQKSRCVLLTSPVTACCLLCLSFACRKAAFEARGVARDGNDTWVIGIHGNTCSLSHCRPPPVLDCINNCLVLGAFPSPAFPALFSLCLASPLVSLACPEKKQNKNQNQRGHRGSSGHHFIAVIDYKTRFPLRPCPRRSC